MIFENKKKATLILADGTEFEGRAFGADGSVVGEIVFTTAMVGYQETLTDPSGTNLSIARDSRFEVGGLVIDYAKYRVYVDGNDVELTQNEYRLVALLGQYAGTVLTYADLIRRMWGPNAKQDNQILRVNMANIRRKIEKDPAHPRYIFTETGIGYRMADK